MDSTLARPAAAMLAAALSAPAPCAPAPCAPAPCAPALCAPASAIDLASLWDFEHPELSEQRFRAALEGASADDRLILQTQIARSYGLRGDFTQARATLAAIEPELPNASAEARTRHALELGRSYASAAHPKAQLTDADRTLARRAFQQALDLARAVRLDALAIDAIHMYAFVDDAPADQLKWGREALAVVAASDQPKAQAWEPSIRNNIGLALHGLGRYEEALAEFNRALELRQRGSDAAATRVAWWMVAWTQRALGHVDEALAIQLRLERECDAAGAPDEYVYEELATLYAGKGEAEQARHYAALQARAKP